MHSIAAQVTNIAADHAKVAAWIATLVIGLLGFALRYIWNTRDDTIAQLRKTTAKLESRMVRVETLLERDKE